MTTSVPAAPARSSHRGFPVRAGLVALTALSIGATAFELATARHWKNPTQLIPWVALTVLVVATVLFVLRPRLLTVVRMLAALVLAISLYGVIEHVLVNYDAGPLDARHGPGWDALPIVEQWWYAITKTVGPAPTLAPGVLGQSTLLLLLATLTPPSGSAEQARRIRVEPEQHCRRLATEGPADTRRLRTQHQTTLGSYGSRT